VSVSKLAREHGINANMLFIWTPPVCQGLCVLMDRKAAVLYSALLQVEPAGLDGIRRPTPHFKYGLYALNTMQAWWISV
jgi:hypothetical protein